MERHLYKTKMCKFASACTRRVCNFAHNPDELKPALCNFGDVCKFKDNKYKPCGFLHPGESKEDFMRRTGQHRTGSERKPIQLTLNNTKPSQPPRAWSSVVKSEPIEPKQESKTIEQPVEHVEQPVEHVEQHVEQSVEQQHNQQKITLELPHNVAMQALKTLETALKVGQTDIQISLVEK